MFRPEIIPPLPWFAHLLWALSAFILLFQWGIAIRWYRLLPARIAIHWGIDLQPDSWGHKRFIFLMPAIYLALFIGFNLILRRPWTFNYPRPLTQENWQDQYITGLVVLRAVMLAVGLLFLGILFLTKRAADKAEKSPAV